MGKIIVLISPTPDGFAESKNVIIEPEFFEFIHSLLATSDAVIFGRNTFEQFQALWPERLKDEHSPGWIRKMAQTLDDIQKIVFSSSMKNFTWYNSTIVNKLDIGYIRSLKTNSTGNILTFGSLSLVESLIEMDVVDDYYFNIQPLISGKGEARLFRKTNLDMVRQLKYIQHKHLNSGAHIIHYQNADTDGKQA